MIPSADGNNEGEGGMDLEMSASSAYQHQTRVTEMRGRTGMDFASSPREFDRYTGLPKNGMELSSDNEEDLIASQTTRMPENERRHYHSKIVSLAASGMYPGLNSHSVMGMSASTGSCGVNDGKPALDSIAYDSDLDRDI